jgi:hypothetical protein
MTENQAQTAAATAQDVEPKIVVDATPTPEKPKNGEEEAVGFLNEMPDRFQNSRQRKIIWLQNFLVPYSKS